MKPHIKLTWCYKSFRINLLKPIHHVLQEAECKFYLYDENIFQILIDLKSPNC